MIKTSLKTLLLLLGNVVWTVSLGQTSDSLTCLNNKEIDYFISQQFDATFLRKDTTFKGEEIRGLNKIVLKQASIISNDESVINIKNKEITDLSTKYVNLSVQYEKQSEKISRNRSLAVVFFCTTLLAATLVVLK